MEATGHIQVLLVDDHAFFRAGLRAMLIEQGVEVVGEAATGEEAVDLAERRRPTVVMMDLNLPGISGADATRRIVDASPSTAVVALTVSAMEDDLLQAIEAGAAGYLLKDATAEEVAGGIHAALEGNFPLTPRLARLLVERARQGPGGRPPEEYGLSARELEVLRLVVEGRANAEIGRELFISPATVKDHVSSILGKLGARNRLQAAIYAVRRGVI